ncbi:hypothetical protein ACFCXS_37870 [Streptomyces sp. NPDC056373]|uniref:hypothetical protein n=1 Tax=Streptomyces sp. NPDC056373 TaxID=3345798 RepID=UPI0035DE4119
MSEEQGLNPRLNEDLRFTPKPGGPALYQATTGKPVQYVTVVDRDGKIIGYVWANDEDDAAGWTVRKAGGDEAFNKGARWARKLREAKARGLTPTGALAEIAGESGPASPSHVVPGSLREAPNLQTVQDLAAKD